MGTTRVGGVGEIRTLSSTRRRPSLFRGALRPDHRALLAWLVPALKDVLSHAHGNTLRRLMNGLRGLGREAWGVGKVLVPGAALDLAIRCLRSELETHLLTALAGGIVIVLAVKPLRSRAFRYLGQALADTGVTTAPSEAPRILEALQRLATLPVERYVPINVLDDAQVKAKLERAGFSRRDGAATPSRAELEAAYDDAFGACTVCFAQFEAGDECVRLLCGRLPPRLRRPVGEHADGVGPRADVPRSATQHAVSKDLSAAGQAEAVVSSRGAARGRSFASGVPRRPRGPSVPGRVRFRPLNCQSPNFSAERRTRAEWHLTALEPRGPRRCLETSPAPGERQTESQESRIVAGGSDIA